MHSAYLSEIWIYPVKSLAGSRVPMAHAGWAGLQHDREWMVIDPHGKFLTQREIPRMALVQAGVTAEGLLLSVRNYPANQVLVPFARDGDRVQVKVWDDQLLACAQGPEADKWLSEELGRAVSLVRMHPDFSKRNYHVPDYPARALRFADDFPYHLISQSSVDELNIHLEEKVDTSRFSPKLVLAGGLPYDDDTLDTLVIGEAKFASISRCDRCVMVNVEPRSGEKGKQPLKTLASFRRHGGKINFGQNLIAVCEGIVREGDQILV